MFTNKYFQFFLIATLTLAIAACGAGSPATAESPAAADASEAPAPAPSCRNRTWLDNAIDATNDVPSLISQLDRDFVLEEGGQWSQPGFTVPAGSVFWTDLFDNAKALPDGVEKVRTQGGWGVYKTSVDYVVPEDNGGGRFMRLCK